MLTVATLTMAILAMAILAMAILAMAMLTMAWLCLLWLCGPKARIATRAEESIERGGRTLNGSQLPLVEANRDYETPLHFAEHFYADMQAAIVSRVAVGTAVVGVATVVQP